MQQPSRRQFVAASLAGLPLLAQAGTAAPLLPAQAPRTGQPAIRTGDPVLDQTLTTLRDLVDEGNANPGARKQAARAIEATLGVHAAHIAANYDARIRRGIKLAEARLGRAGVIEQCLRHVRSQGRHDLTYDGADAALTALEKHGVAGTVRDMQRALRGVRLHAADGLQAAAFLPAQYDFCADLNWILEMAEWVAGFTCVLAILEPTWALEPFCLAAQFYVASLKLMKWWHC
jgi:hypothetical protein